MKFNILKEAPATFPAHVVMGVHESSFDAPASNSCPFPGRDRLADLVAKHPHWKKYGEITLIPAWSDSVDHLVLVGLGKITDISYDKLRSLAGSLSRFGRKNALPSLALHPSHWHNDQLESEKAIAAFTEGFILGAYQFEEYKSEKAPHKPIGEISYLSAGETNTDKWQKAVDEAQVVAASVCLARDLVNHPGQYMTPIRMAEYAKNALADSTATYEAFDEKFMQQEKMGSFLSVSQGSDNPPRLIVMHHNGNPSSQEKIALVGKGITFDSGGISLKPGEGMGAMKDDMAGAAAVIAAFQAIVRLGLPVNVVAIAACAENMPSGHASRPGDIVTSMSGKTIEIISTDAEGRLVLADAVSYAKKIGATKVVDVATLTGACVVSLGHVTSGLVWNNKEWCDAVLAAAGRADEKMWAFPNYEEYLELIKSPIADLKNSGGRHGGAITGGIFIGQFAESTPWVHIDIAGTSSSEKDQGYWAKGGTGVAVKTLVELIRQS